eukprot:10627239-Alexandrium_andersonii.AAC.1
MISLEEMNEDMWLDTGVSSVIRNPICSANSRPGSTYLLVMSSHLQPSINQSSTTSERPPPPPNA